ncbi:MAG TPA: transposase [Gemmataceae bacterium]|nr:transposase [Gemmataceae bacterium]
MPRVPRQAQQATGCYYHVMNRGHNREVVFACDEDYRYFLDLVDRYRQRFPWRLYHDCLMGNHFHLLVRCEDPKALSACLAGLLLSYVHYAHRRYGFVGHLWQGRFKSPVVAAEQYFLSCARYIERNPVVAGIVALPWEYRWSSAPAYALGKADPLLSYNVWYRELGGDDAQRQQRWREFLLGDDPREEEVRRGDWTTGDDAFRRRVQRQASRPARRRGRPRKGPVRAEGFFPQLYADESE